MQADKQSTTLLVYKQNIRLSTLIIIKKKSCKIVLGVIFYIFWTRLIPSYAPLTLTGLMEVKKQNNNNMGTKTVKQDKLQSFLPPQVWSVRHETHWTFSPKIPSSRHKSNRKKKKLFFEVCKACSSTDLEANKVRVGHCQNCPVKLYSLILGRWVHAVICFFFLIQNCSFF